MATKLEYCNHTERNILWVPSYNGYLTICTKDILYIKSDVNYSRIFFTDGRKPYLCSKTLKEFEIILHQIGYIRVHQSFLVNPNHIQSFSESENQLLLHNGNTVPVSRRKRAVFYHQWKNG